MKSGQSSQGGGRDPISVWIKREVLGRGITSLSHALNVRAGTRRRLRILHTVCRSVYTMQIHPCYRSETRPYFNPGPVNERSLSVSSTGAELNGTGSGRCNEKLWRTYLSLLKTRSSLRQLDQRHRDSFRRIPLVTYGSSDIREIFWKHWLTTESKSEITSMSKRS